MTQIRKLKNNICVLKKEIILSKWLKEIMNPKNNNVIKKLMEDMKVQIIENNILFMNKLKLKIILNKINVQNWLILFAQKIRS